MAEVRHDAKWLKFAEGKDCRVRLTDPKPQPKPQPKRPFHPWLPDFVFLALVWLSGLFIGLWLYAAFLR